MSKTTDSRHVEDTFFKELGSAPKTMAYIPSKTDSSRKYFSKVKDHFELLGVSEVLYCDLDEEYHPSVFQKLQSSDLIYLAGGFTPYFLKILQDRGAIKLILEMSKDKPLIGVSAGALIMGKDISILFNDPNEGEAAQALTDPRGIGLYSFEFWPHYGRLPNDSQRLKDRSKLKRVISCDDNSGLIVNGEKVIVAGTAYAFSNESVLALKNCHLAHWTSQF